MANEKKGQALNASAGNHEPNEITIQFDEKDFQLNDREKELIHNLFDWCEQSKKTNWVLGQPL